MKPEHRIIKLAQTLVKDALGVKEWDKVAVVSYIYTIKYITISYQQLFTLLGYKPTNGGIRCR